MCITNLCFWGYPKGVHTCNKVPLGRTDFHGIRHSQFATAICPCVPRGERFQHSHPPLHVASEPRVVSPGTHNREDALPSWALPMHCLQKMPSEAVIHSSDVAASHFEAHAP